MLDMPDAWCAMHHHHRIVFAWLHGNQSSLLPRERDASFLHPCTRRPLPHFREGRTPRLALGEPERLQPGNERLLDRVQVEMICVEIGRAWATRLLGGSGTIINSEFYW